MSKTYLEGNLAKPIFFSRFIILESERERPRTCENRDGWGRIEGKGES